MGRRDGGRRVGRIGEFHRSSALAARSSGHVSRPRQQSILGDDANDDDCNIAWDWYLFVGADGTAILDGCCCIKLFAGRWLGILEVVEEVSLTGTGLYSRRRGCVGK